MKIFSVCVIAHTLLLALISVTSYILYKQHLWFCMSICIIILIGIGLNLYRMQLKQIAMMKRLMQSIQYNDMAQTFQPPFKNKLMKEFAEKLSDALKSFREHLLAEEVKHLYYENLLEKVDTAVLVADTSGHIEWMNHAAITNFGSVPVLPQQLLEIPTNDTHVVRIERNGTTFEMAASCTIFSAQEKALYLISLKNIHSVLEQNEMEAWQKLIRVLTHEIMNSITPIISLSETLSERKHSENPTSKEYTVILQAMQAIHKRSKGLLNFVENYRKLTRIPLPVYKDVLIAALFTDLKKLFPEEYIHFDSPEKSITLNIDRSLIEQVLINLIKNAREACYKKENKQIQITFSALPNGHSLLMIKDNGEGILPEAMDKIFVPFFTTKKSGSGIGLSLCKQIINLHGGNITVHSEVGQGSNFMLHFPVKS